MRTGEHLKEDSRRDICRLGLEHVFEVPRKLKQTKKKNSEPWRKNAICGNNQYKAYNNIDRNYTIIER